MKILFVTDALAVWGGLERVLMEKANWLVENSNDDVTILTTSQCGRPYVYALNPAVSLVDMNIEFHRQYRYRGLSRYLEAVRLHHRFRNLFRTQLFDIQPDVIDCVRLDLIADVLKVKGSIPVVYESHSSFWASRFESAGLLRQVHTLWLNLKVRHAQAVVALTSGDAKEWRKVNKSVSVIPNIVHLNNNTYSDCLSKSAVFVGRLSKQKDVGSLLAIWELVHQKFPDWKLHIYGERGDAEVEVFRKLGQMSDSVKVHVPVDNIFEAYKKHSILLFTSLYEPFGLVIPEAMSCGLPVIAFECPYGPADLINDGMNGFLIKHRDVSSFVEKLCLLMDSSFLRQRIGYSASTSVKQISPELIMKKWKKLVGSIIVTNSK